MKKIKVLALLLAMLMVFTACGQTESPEENGGTPPEPVAEEAIVSSSGAQIPTVNELKIPEGEVITVGYLAQNETDQFCVFMGDSLASEAAKFGASLELLTSDAQGQAANQVSQAENMVSKGVDVVIISAVDKDACAPAVQTVVDAGIPIITLNTVVVNNDLATAYVGVNDEEAGVVAMEIMGEALGGEGTVNIILGQLGHPASEYRWTGVQTKLKDYPGITIGASLPADWDRAKAMSVTEDWMSGGVDFNGIIAMNDEMAISAAHALAAANVTDVKVVGVDALDEALELVKSGKMAGTVFQDAAQQGRGALLIAVAAVLGIDIEKEYLIPFKKVTMENVDEFM